MKFLVTWFRNRRFRIRQYTARYPWMFYTLYQLSPGNKKLMVTRHTRITIEGYPRSANTYAVYAFKHVNQMQWNEIAHHLHVQAQIIRSIKYKIPVILLIRHPLEAVRSLVVRHDFIPVDEALEDYYRFYNDLYPLKDGFVVANFEMVTRDCGEIIRQVNKKFSSGFNIYPEKDDDMNAAVLNEIDIRNRQMDKGKVTHLYRPDKDKEALKNLVEIDENSEPFQQALSIYQKYTEIN